jgi:hypothetical protein
LNNFSRLQSLHEGNESHARLVGDFVPTQIGDT